MGDSSVPGFVVPFFKVTTQPLLFMGAPKTFTFVNFIVMANLVIALHALWYIPIGLGLQSLGALLSRRDPEFFDAFRRYFHHKDYLQP